MKVEDVKQLLVVGAGIMGSGIAQTAATTGLSVTMCDVSEEYLDQAKANIRRRLDRAVQREKLTQDQANQVYQRLQGSTNLEEAAKSADFVVEAVTENLRIKQQIFEILSQNTKPDVILASNTSSISITLLAASTTKPDKVIGMHFFNPVPIMKLVEIINGYHTTAEVYQLTENLAKKMGKDTVKAEESPGFIVNRMLVPMLNEAIFLLQEGVASKEDIDKAMKLGLNHPMGPLTLADFVGLDTLLAIGDVLYEEFRDSKYRPPLLLRKMIRAGMYGKKTGKGFYDYTKNK